MASIRKEIVIARRVEDVWDALADIGELHTRLAPGFVSDCRLEPGARVVTFANGAVARELIVDIDADARRFAWAVVGSAHLTHHGASAQVLPDDGGGSRFVWIADFLPDAFAPVMAGMIDAGLAAMKKHLEASAAAAMEPH